MSPFDALRAKHLFAIVLKMPLHSEKQHHYCKQRVQYTFHPDVAEVGHCLVDACRRQCIEQTLRKRLTARFRKEGTDKKDAKEKKGVA